MSGIKLVAPRPGKTPNYYLRGTLHNVYVDQTTGTADRAEARKALRKVVLEIKNGAHVPNTGITFEDGALSYLQGGGDDRFVAALINHFRGVKLGSISQAMIDQAAATLYPDAGAATRNRQVYTPVSAILKRSNIDFAVKRPKGAQGEVRNTWLQKDDAFAVLAAAKKVDAELGTFIALLLYTGLRLSEATAIKTDWINLDEAFIYIPKTKNEDPRLVHLPPVLIAELKAHPRGLDRPRDKLFRFRKGGYLYNLKAKVEEAIGWEFTFHGFRHTWASWMRRYAGLDTKGLMATGAWKDEKSAARYQHVVVTEEMIRSNMLPTPPISGKDVDTEG